MASNQRIYYACEGVGVAPFGSLTFTAVHGLQSVGITTKFNLEQIFEIGQLNIYQQVQGLPDIEVTTEKVLDGYPLLWHLATQGAPDASLVGRSTQRFMLGLSIFSDLQSAASGSAFQQVTCSGLYASAITYDIKIQGPATESLTSVGNNKTWANAASGQTITFNGGFTDADVPLAPEGVNLRQNIIMASSIFPLNIPGIDSTGHNDLNSAGYYNVKFQSVRVSANLGRDQLLELGHKAAYFRYVNFPVEIKTDFEILDIQGDLMNATELGNDAQGNNLGSGDHIYIQMTEGTKLDMGNINLLSSVNYTGGNAGARGGNVHSTWSYITFNNLSVYHPQDPTVALRA